MPAAASCGVSETGGMLRGRPVDRTLETASSSFDRNAEGHEQLFRPRLTSLEVHHKLCGWCCYLCCLAPQAQGAQAAADVRWRRGADCIISERDGDDRKHVGWNTSEGPDECLGSNRDGWSVLSPDDCCVRTGCNRYVNLCRSAWPQGPSWSTRSQGPSWSAWPQLPVGVVGSGTLLVAAEVVHLPKQMELPLTQG